MSKDLLFHKDAIGAFHDIFYSDIYMDYAITNDEMVIKEKTEDGDTIIYEGFPLKDKKTYKTYFIRSSYKDASGEVHRVKFPIKIKQSRKIIWGKKVYYLADYVTTKFPSSNKLSFHEFVDKWFPIEHHSEEDKMVAKLVTLTTMLTNSFAVISTPPSFGKDGLVSNIYNLTMFGRNMSGGSEAKVAQMLDDEHTTFNEVVGISKKNAEVLYPFFKGVAAGQKFYEHTTTGSNATKNRYDIGNYGFVVFFNEPDKYVEAGKITWEEQYDYAVFDRVFPVLLSGTVKKQNQYTNVYGIDWKQYVLDHKQDYIDFIGRFYYDLENIDSQKLLFPLSKYNIEYRQRNKGEDSVRWLQTFQNIGRIVSRYVESKYTKSEQEKEFYRIMDLVYDRNRKYIKTVTELNLIESDLGDEDEN